MAGRQIGNDAAQRELLVGLSMAELLLYGDEWIRRRVESFEFTGVETVRRQMSIDFALPAHADRIETVDPQVLQDLRRFMSPVLVPVLTLEKRKLTRFDMWDEDSRSLPLLTTYENGTLAGLALIALASAVALSYGWEDLPPDVASALGGVAMLPIPLAGLLLAGLRDWPPGHDEKLERYAPRLDGDDRRKPAEKKFYELATGVRRIHEEGPRHRHRTILADPTVDALAEKLSTDFVVFAPVSEPVDTRRIYKVSYEAQLAAPNARGRETLVVRARRWTEERCAWRPKSYALGRIAVGQAESHHLEISAPEGTVVSDAVFSAVFPREPDEMPPGVDPTYDKRSDTAERRDVSRVHLYLRDLPVQAEATALIRVNVDSSGPLNAGLIVTAIIAAILWGGYGRLDDIAAADAATALMIAVPSVFAFYVARLDEHALVQHLMSGVRFFIYLSAGVAFLAAGSIAFGYDHEELRSLWGVLRYAALLPVLGLVVSWLQLRLRSRQGKQDVLT